HAFIPISATAPGTHARAIAAASAAREAGPSISAGNLALAVGARNLPPGVRWQKRRLVRCEAGVAAAYLNKHVRRPAGKDDRKGTRTPSGDLNLPFRRACFLCPPPSHHFWSCGAHARSAVWGRETPSVFLASAHPATRQPADEAIRPRHTTNEG